MKFTPVQPFNLKFIFSFIVASFSSALMYFIISQSKIYYLNIFLAIFIGIIIYFLGFIGLNFFVRNILVTFIRRNKTTGEI
ncbi:hypothetical protein AMJ49_03160 [Parcubacteria bacterium DG_74_2]|nr:MAG: hypothetical protein AMJ49_03160 [Parcubacteria bacterium DG_74_2]